MTLDQVMKELKSFANEDIKGIYINHGAQEPLFGVRVGDLHKIVKMVKKDHGLALELWNTGNSDAMYLAGLIADETRVTRDELNRWAGQAYWYMLSEYAVAGLAAESPHAFDLAREWVQSDREMVATAGWSVWCGIVASRADSDLDLEELKKLLGIVEAQIHKAANRVRYAMNQFVISVGGYVRPLSGDAMAVAESIGKVEVDMGNTSCKVPSAPEYIRRMVKHHMARQKPRTLRC